MADEGEGEGDEIRLQVPTTPQLLRLVRVTASGLAARLGFSNDAVEDVRLAVDELCTTVASTSGPASTLAVRFVIQDAAFTVEGRVQPGPGALAKSGALSVLSERLLGTLVEDYQLIQPANGQGAGFRMRTKHA